VRIIHCKQGTPEWLAARAGVVTASEFETARSKLSRASGSKKAGDPTAASDRYAAEKAIERISGKPYGEPIKAWVLERGHELEEHARIAYEATTGEFVTESGIALTDDGLFGYSTDGLVGEDGLIEIKCPIDGSKIAAMWQTGDVSEYISQMQGGMWITGRKWCDFVMYVPDLEKVGRHRFVKRIYRDDDFIECMVDDLLQFNRTVDAYVRLFTYSRDEAAA
jgi:exodeoxyribonuclease (lambda-induced)